MPLANDVTISTMARSELPEVVDLWNEAVAAQGEGYERHLQSVERLARTMDDPNFLPAGALTARRAGELVGFALGYVQTIDFLGAGDLSQIPGRLAGVAVRPDAWRQGIGRALLRAVEKVLAQHGKSEISCAIYHAMPLALMYSIRLDTGPYHFLRACGYTDAGPHGLMFHNDIAHFQLQDWVIDRRQRLESEGITFRWYVPADRPALLAFMAEHFSTTWQAIMETAVSGPSAPQILLALAPAQRLAAQRLAGFIGPFDVREEGRFYFSTDARTGWGSFGCPGVAPAFRQRGIGTVLWHLGFDHLRRSGVEFTEYATGLQNPAQYLYFHSGAMLTGISCEELRRPL